MHSLMYSSLTVDMDVTCGRLLSLQLHSRALISTLGIRVLSLELRSFSTAGLEVVAGLVDAAPFVSFPPPYTRAILFLDDPVLRCLLMPVCLPFGLGHDTVTLASTSTTPTIT